MKIKKALCVGAASLLALSMVFCMAASCNSDSSGSSGSESGSGSSGGSTTTGGTITVWCPSEAVSLTTSQLATFTTENPECPYTFTIEAVGEGEAATSLLTDVTAGADIYFFAQDQLARLVQADALSAVSSTYVERVSSRNDSGSVAAGTVSDTLYAYPLTSDNGYFMYYDKSLLSEEDITNQTTIIEKCVAANRSIGFDLTDSGWYAAAYFFATGCVSEWNTDSDGNYTSYNDTFNSDAGVIAVKGMAELINCSVFLGGSDGESAASLGDGTGAAVVVSGTWDYTTAAEILGDNLGCAKLWSFTVDGVDYQLGSFSGNKLLGVKPQTDSTRAAWCQAIANYLTDETCQQQRFESLAWGPSNTNAQDSEEVQANPGLAALAAQSEYATPQGQFPNAWWDVSKAIGANILNLGTTSVTTTQAKEILDTYSDGLETIMAAVTELIVVGTMADNSWTVTPDEASYYINYETNTWADKSESKPLIGTWTFEVTLEAEGMFRICSSGWDTYVDYDDLTSDSYSGLYSAGSDNSIGVDVAGTYTVVLDSSTGTWSIKVTLNS